MTLFFEGWQPIVRILITAPLAYLAIVAMVRLSGKRSTSQMNNFDWIVTVAIGSIAGSTVVLGDVPLANGLVAIASLLLLQWILTKASVYSTAVSDLVRADPAIVLCRGELQEEVMKSERITTSEIMAALRENGIHDPEDVEAVVLESDAKLSVLRSMDGEGSCATLRNAANYAHLYDSDRPALPDG